MPISESDPNGRCRYKERGLHRLRAALQLRHRLRTTERPHTFLLRLTLLYWGTKMLGVAHTSQVWPWGI